MCSARMVPRIARLLRRFHGIQVDLPRHPHAPWGVIDEWMAKAQQVQFTDPVKQVRQIVCVKNEELHMWLQPDVQASERRYSGASCALFWSAASIGAQLPACSLDYDIRMGGESTAVPKKPQERAMEFTVCAVCCVRCLVLLWCRQHTSR
jgi:hypothetical protein